MRVHYVASLLGVLSAQALAQDTNVTTLAKSAKVGAEFRAELKYDDHGLEKEDGGSDPKATSILQVQTMKLKLSGNVNDKTEYSFRFNLLNPDPTKGALDYGYGTHWITDMVGFSIGKMRVMQGGWDNMDNGFRDHAQGHYTNSFFFDKYEPMLALQAKLAGKLQLQLLNDVTKADGGSYNSNAHPTFVIGWMGDFGGISPIIDIGTFDNQKSNWADIGVKADIAGVKAGLDYRTVNVASPKAGSDDSETTTHTGITVKAAYEVKDVVTPGIYFSTYDVKQPNTDAKTNTAVGEEGYSTASFDDNGQTMAFHVNVHALGKGWTPYLAYVMNSGKFPKASDATKEESKSGSMVRLGVLGEF